LSSKNLSNLYDNITVVYTLIVIVLLICYCSYWCQFIR